MVKDKTLTSGQINYQHDDNKVAYTVITIKNGEFHNMTEDIRLDLIKRLQQNTKQTIDLEDMFEQCWKYKQQFPTVEMVKMKIPTIEEIIDYINKHLKTTGEKPSSFGRRVLGDSGAMTRLMNEKTDIRLSTLKKIVNAISGTK